MEELNFIGLVKLLIPSLLLMILILHVLLHFTLPLSLLKRRLYNYTGFQLGNLRQIEVGQSDLPSIARVT